MPENLLSSMILVSEKISHTLNQRRTENHRAPHGYVLFSSPSAAAFFVLGASVNGRAGWTNKRGQRLNEIKARLSDEMRQTCPAGQSNTLRKISLNTGGPSSA